MKKEIQYAIALIGLGVSLVAYAHGTFSTKSTVENMDDRIKIIDKRVYEIHGHIFKGVKDGRE